MNEADTCRGYEVSKLQAAGWEDGFIAPYRAHRVITTFDAAGWRPNAGDIDRMGREIPDREYTTKDFEQVVAPHTPFAVHISLAEQEIIVARVDHLTAALAACEDHAVQSGQDIQALRRSILTGSFAPAFTSTTTQATSVAIAS